MRHDLTLSAAKVLREREELGDNFDLVFIEDAADVVTRIRRALDTPDAPDAPDAKMAAGLLGLEVPRTQ